MHTYIFYLANKLEKKIKIFFYFIDKLNSITENRDTGSIRAT